MMDGQAIYLDLFFVLVDKVQKFFTLFESYRRKMEQVIISINYNRRVQMVLGKSNKLIDTKNSNNTNPKSIYSLSDMNRLYRREESYKKKLKVLIETNSLLESRILVYEETIRDQREGILFQLNELSKTMNSKVSTYLNEKLDRESFKDNNTAQETIKQMIQKFEEVQKQTKITKKVHQNLNSIYQRYISYGEEIDKLVKLTEKSNKDYEDSMKHMLYQKQAQIFKKRNQNDSLFEDTQTASNKIDEFEEGKLRLIEEESQLQRHIEQLQQVERATLEEVKKFQKWAQIVIDKNHRKTYNLKSKEKQVQLQKLQQTNQGLQIYLRELNNEELRLQKLLQQSKENVVLSTKNALGASKTAVMKKPKSKYAIQIKI